MEFTLNKANKLLQKLKQHRSHFPAYHPISSVVFKGIDLEQEDSIWGFKAIVAEAIDKKHKDIQQEFDIIEDIHKLKESLFEANIKAGVSKLMREKEFNSLKLSKLTSMLNEVDNNDNIVEEVTLAFVKTGLESESRYERFGIAIYKKEDLEKQITSLTQVISDIEDQILALNATIKINFEFTQASKKILGLR